MKRAIALFILIFAEIEFLRFWVDITYKDTNFVFIMLFSIAFFTMGFLDGISTNGDK
jgi:hypothetical protein